MGTCYSSHSPTGKRTYPSDMSINSQRSGQAPLPRPAYTGHSNKMPEKPGERAALTPRSHSATRLPQPRSESSPNRFGFKKQQPGKSGVMRSTDSIDSMGSDMSKSSYGSQKRLNQQLNNSYTPRESKGWKMIDDSSTVDSRSHSTKSKSTSKSTASNGSASNTPLKSQGKRSLGGSSGIGRGGREPATVPMKASTPSDTDKWVKAGPMDSAESLKENRNQINTKKKFGFFGRSKSATSQSLLKTLQPQQPVKGKKDEQNDEATATQDPCDALKETYSIQPASSGVTSVKEDVIVPEKEETVQTSVILIETSAKKITVRSGRQNTDSKSDMEKSVETVKPVPPVEDSNGKKAVTDGKRSVPLARMDSVETGSVSSLNSDDLMLDMDDEMMLSTTSASMEQSMSRSRALSDALDTSTCSKQSRRPNPTRPRLSDSASIPRRNLLERQASDRQLRPRGHSVTETVQELGSLLGDSVQRRHPKLEQSTRPASFPGPLGGEELVKSLSLRPPRQPSLVEDEDQVAMDGYTYRHMQQDITTFKTMLLKLKRVIQEDELGSPMDPNYKNGLRYGRGSSATTPDSPLVKTEESWKTALLGATALPEGPGLVEVMQENSELRQQLQVMQRQLEDHEKTIKLLQQQMETALRSQRGCGGQNNALRSRARGGKTKYEIGHFGPGGSVYSNAATQTDKPRLPTTTRGAGRLSARGTSGSSENIISLRQRKSSSPNENVPQVDNTKSESEKGVLQPVTAQAISSISQSGASKLPSSTQQKKPADKWRPKVTKIKSFSSTLPGPARRSAGEPVRQFSSTLPAPRRTSTDARRVSSDSHARRSSLGMPAHRSSVDSRPCIGTSRESLHCTSSESLHSTKSNTSTCGSKARSQRCKGQGSMETLKSSTDTGVAELSSPDAQVDSLSADASRHSRGPSAGRDMDSSSADTGRTSAGSGGKDADSSHSTGTCDKDTMSCNSGRQGRQLAPPATRSRIPSPLSRLPTSHLSRPYAAARGSRIASLSSQSYSRDSKASRP